MRIPLLDGRDFKPDDKLPGAVIVNQAFAHSYLDGRNPVGQTIETMPKDKRVPSMIVGYVGDARYRNMRESIRPTIYVPLSATPAGTHWTTLVVRTKTSNPLAMASILRQEVRRTNPDFRVVNIRTQTELVEQHTVRERLLAMLSVFFAIVALALAGIGLYGVLSYSVLERRREIGIRMALGASMKAVAGRVAAEIAAMLAIGSIAGLIAGLASERYIETLLYQVKATDAGILAAPVLTVVAIALLASLPPIMDAVRIDPAVTLRAE
jgi:ABC-type antimicrobial peptide transport system permease subunit